MLDQDNPAIGKSEAECRGLRAVTADSGRLLRSIGRIFRHVRDERAMPVPSSPGATPVPVLRFLGGGNVSFGPACEPV